MACIFHLNSAIIFCMGRFQSMFRMGRVSSHYSYSVACLLAALMLFAAPVFAAAPKAPPAAITFLNDAQLKPHLPTISRVATYLSGLSTIVADFTQVAPDGSLASGTFYLQRPGKMRWQYNPPTPVLMIANGSQFVYYDYELEQVSYIPLDSALVGFLAQEKIVFGDKVGITFFEAQDRVIRIGLAQIDKPTEGRLTLELSDNPMQIRRMIVTDASNQVTSIALSGAKFDQKLDKSLFIFNDPRQGPRGARNRTAVN
jgi:outer membrane lipoprotein-sorting protein